MQDFFIMNTYLSLHFKAKKKQYIVTDRLKKRNKCNDRNLVVIFGFFSKNEKNIGKKWQKWVIKGKKWVNSLLNRSKYNQIPKWPKTKLSKNA